MNYYTHLYESTVINAPRIRSMVNLMLKARVRYPPYILIHCKRVHYTSVELTQVYPNELCTRAFLYMGILPTLPAFKRSPSM